MFSRVEYRASVSPLETRLGAEFNRISICEVQAG